MKLENIEIFEKLYTQIKGIYSELCILSKKAPDGSINKFKLKFVNQIILIANQILGTEYAPFTDFELFDEDDMSTNSDVVFILSQYIKCLEKYKFDNIYRSTGHWYWRLEGSKEQIETSSPPTELYL
ncbi:hypothetical protein K5I21_03775 [[Clostridium] symbiosum]|jgi:hypothetical protein|uniref:Uncharacterized protein n=1 Tax=Clostridium symbiosum TaxID=1512 RepID=A0AAW5EZC7_CLOSY|nr:hypothetical protein [[Clostridium] symbiosum]MCK0085013.1 hypothetical protein [[Clostridium] symbiosum]